jgi:fatty-acyl-CoA synthase
MSVTFVAPGLSHVLGPVDAPLLNLKIHELFGILFVFFFFFLSFFLPFFLQERSESCCKVFVVDNNKRSFTFAEIGEMSRRFASNITKLGFTRGDRLGVWLPNRFEYVVALIGCSYAGIVLTTMNPAYRASELHHAASLVGIRGLVLQPKVKSSDYLAILKDAGNIPSLDFVFVCDGT